jgi:hypothetical protein
MNRRTHTGATEFYDRNGKLVGAFMPNGALRPNKKLWGTKDPVQAARLFVGFNVGQDPTWSMGKLMELVKRIRAEQKLPPDASFLFQKGYYTHEASKELVEEEGAQIIVLNIFDQSRKAFERDVRRLADKIAYAMKQESVIIEFQDGGKTYETLSMGRPGK